MNKMKNKNGEKPMSWLAFQIMRLVMNLRKNFRKIEAEINFAGIKKGFFILDFGCGLGFNTIPAAKAVGREGKVYALDLSPQAIKIMEKKILKNNLINIELICSGCETGLEAESIDLVYLHNTLPIVKEKGKVLKEITRVLKSGGVLSYMSRTGARIYGKGQISDSRLEEILKPDFLLKKANKGHLIFEKK